MKSLLMVLTMGAVGVGLVACSDKTEFNMERDTAPMERNMSSEVSEFKDWAEERSEDIEERMEVLERDMDKAGAEAKKEMKAAWNDLKALNEKIEGKISRIFRIFSSLLLQWRGKLLLIIECERQKEETKNVKKM